MKLSQFSGLSKQTVKLLCKSGSTNQKEWSLGDEVAFIEEDGSFYLIQGDNTALVEPEGSREALRIKISSSQPLWSLTSIKKDFFLLRSVDLPEAATELNLDIGVKTINAEFLFEKGMINSANMKEAEQWLKNEFILEGESRPRVFASVYMSSNNKGNFIEGSKRGTFELRGREWLASLNEFNSYWNLSKLTQTRKSATGLRILQGNIRFVDSSAAGQLNKPMHKHALEEIIRSHGSYTELWQQYSRTEWTMKVEAARHLGSLSYKSFEKGKKEKEWIFLVKNHSANAFNDKWKKLARSDSGSKRDFKLEVMPHLPDWLDNDQDVETSGLTGGKGRPWLCDLISIEDGLITLKLDRERDAEPPKEGFICLSMHGDRKVIQRRNNAVESIQQRNNPMPQLRFLLEGAEVPIDHRKTIKALPSSSSARKQFKGEPTIMQRKALEVALNTPDIAIIIGPPGSGKTLVITALQTRLAEELKDLPIRHQMLVSSFQHDAVDNVMARSSVFGLAAVKVGGKGKKLSDQNDNPVTAWCKGKAEVLRESLGKKLAEQPVFTEIRQLERKLNILYNKLDYQERQLQIKDINHSLDILKSEYKISLAPALTQQWQEWVSKQLNIQKAGNNQSENRLFLRMVRGLRTTAIAFEDDGSTQCLKVLDWVDRIGFEISDNDKQLLTTLTHKAEVSQKDLQRLSVLKDHLLDQLLPDYRPRHIQQVLDVNECTLIDQIRNDIDRQIMESRSLGYLKVLEEYLSALQHSPESIRTATLEYTSVLGATCQQAASENMVDLKQVQFQDAISFNSVIIDEAARANPLDLMIPMAMAKRRIILVGDHRQLPHLLEPSVEDELAERFEFDTVHKEMLNESLFKRLIDNLKKLEEEKKQPRRVVMLDQQFRMHPVLGKFISEQFYERYGLPEVKAGIEDENHFTHNLSGYEGKVCGWINVPASRGKSVRLDGSLQREIEAEIIAKEAHRILEQRPELNVGVITFYRSQVNTILQTMEPFGLTESGEYDIPKIKPEWQHTVNQKGEQVERLRVGTVDAFQGKEFDIVLLSMVRTLPQNIDPQNDASLTKAYGFLRLDNRLNVAMSRQKRLLIMVGDTSMATHPAAETAAPSIQAFYKLCRGGYGKLF